MSIMLGVAIASGVMSAFSNNKAMNAQSDAYKRQAREKLKVIDQLRERNKLNTLMLERKQQSFIGGQAAQASSSGADLSGSTLLAMAQTAEDVGRKQITNNMEMESEIGRLNAEISMANSQAKDARSAATWGTFTDLLGTGVSAYNAGYGGRGTKGAQTAASSGMTVNPF